MIVVHLSMYVQRGLVTHTELTRGRLRRANGKALQGHGTRELWLKNRSHHQNGASSTWQTSRNHLLSVSSLRESGTKVHIEKQTILKNDDDSEPLVNENGAIEVVRSVASGELKKNGFFKLTYICNHVFEIQSSTSVWTQWQTRASMTRIQGSSR